MEDTIDLFEQYQTLPQEVQDIIITFRDDYASYQECERLLAELEPYGYTFDYGLDATPFGLEKISNCEIGDECYLKDWIVQDSELLSNHGTVIKFEREKQPYLVDGQPIFNWYVHLKMSNGENAIVNGHEIEKLY